MRRPRNQFPAWDSIPVQAIAEASLFRFSKRSARRGWEWPLNWFCAVRPSGDPESNPEALLLLLPPSLVGLGAPHGPCLRSPAPGGGKRSAGGARVRDARLRCAWLFPAAPASALAFAQRVELEAAALVDEPDLGEDDLVAELGGRGKRRSEIGRASCRER